jgi:hypothetical protein
MKETLKTEPPASAESIARLADNGQDISSYFTNDGTIMPPLEIDLNEDVIQEATLPEEEGTDSPP